MIGGNGMKYNKPLMEILEPELNLEVITSSLKLDDEKEDDNTVGFPTIGIN